MCYNSGIMKLTLALFIAGTMCAFGQSGPLVSSQKTLFDLTKTNIMRSVEKVPDDMLTYKPVDTVRSFAELAGHVADAQYLFCSAVSGDKPERRNVEKTKTGSKADLTAALKEAFDYCDKTFTGLSDAQAAEVVKFFGSERPRLAILSFNTAHNMEHYGNMVTYMRMKGIVPPSSERR
jgi:uncharacterized damage-inducible protein DinB